MMTRTGCVFAGRWFLKKVPVICNVASTCGRSTHTKENDREEFRSLNRLNGHWLLVVGFCALLIVTVLWVFAGWLLLDGRGWALKWMGAPTEAFWICFEWMANGKKGNIYELLWFSVASTIFSTQRIQRQRMRPKGSIDVQSFDEGPIFFGSTIFSWSLEWQYIRNMMTILKGNFIMSTHFLQANCLIALVAECWMRLCVGSPWKWPFIERKAFVNLFPFSFSCYL